MAVATNRASAISQRSKDGRTDDDSDKSVDALGLLSRSTRALRSLSASPPDGAGLLLKESWLANCVFSWICFP